MESVRTGLRVLVVDDEPEMADLISRSLVDDGYAVRTAADGIRALSIADGEHFDLAVVDVMMPGMSGFELCRRLREQIDGIGIVLLTARDAVDDRVRGLDSGADDYLTKPFALAELSARLRALRRRADIGAIRSEVGNLVLIAHRYRATVDGREVPLSRTEFDLIRLLAANAGTVVARSRLLDEIWGSTQYQSNIVDQYVSYARRKLLAAGANVRIVTERGVGFALTADQ
ncbi:two-component system, OmpR family, response regulator [Agromyces sp. CF514]|uniref:response regulator transcription factor n=1 Tax=Agromyces sp. CF514 TaxID=1881031 RepID=UPI0008E28C06|nr:response regulator transcription factor [Agromyces sp. CF514]SFR74628.1 two-component system, OmpR family, response regulator [Agromyces sp. CF514]